MYIGSRDSVKNNIFYYQKLGKQLLMKYTVCDGISASYILTNSHQRKQKLYIY
jgi:hypothetical protein